MNEKDKAYLDAIDARYDAAMKYLGRCITTQDMKKYEEIEKQSAGIHVPKDVHLSILKMIKEEHRRMQAQKRVKHFRKAVKACLIAFILLSISGTILIGTVDAFKYRFRDFVAAIQQEYFHLTPQDEVKDAENLLECWYPQYLPFQFAFDQIIQKEDIKILLFRNLHDGFIRIDQQPANGASLYLDNEETQSVWIDGVCNGYMAKNERGTFLYWVQHDCLFSISSNIDESEIIKIAESLVYRK